MYCSHCGMKLPDWARYCERCGARVKHAATQDDPMEHIGLDDTSASEPLWIDEVREEEAPAKQTPATSTADTPAGQAPQTDAYDADKTIIDAASLFKRAMGDVKAQDDSEDFSQLDLPEETKARVREATKSDDNAAEPASDADAPSNTEDTTSPEDAADLTHPMPEEELETPVDARETTAGAIPAFLVNATKRRTPEAADAFAQNMNQFFEARDTTEDEPASVEPTEEDISEPESSDLTQPMPVEELEDLAEASESVEDQESPKPSDDLTQALSQDELEELALEEAGEEEAEDAPESEPSQPSDEDEDAPASHDDPSEPSEEPAQDESESPESTDAPPRQPAERERIDVGENDGPSNMPVTMYHPYYDTWQGRQRPSERIKAQQSSPSFAVMAALAASIILLSLLIAHVVLEAGMGSQDQTPVQQEVVASSRSISKRKAKKIIESLEGWWTTRRTFDGRFWRIKEGVIETYSADGNLTKQRPIDPDAIERMSEGPGGIEGEGYYLRNVAFYLQDEDPDTLHAISGDGSTNEDANLLRCDPPSFADQIEKEEEKKDAEKDESPKEEKKEPEEKSEEAAEEEAKDNTGEYLLPESSTRVYELDELRKLSDHELFVARNEIFAKHGYVFGAGGELNEYFGSKSWYQPAEVFNEGDMNEIERENVNNIISVEQERGSQYL